MRARHHGYSFRYQARASFPRSRTRQGLAGSACVCQGPVRMIALQDCHGASGLSETPPRGGPDRSLVQDEALTGPLASRAPSGLQCHGPREDDLMTRGLYGISFPSADCATIGAEWAKRPRSPMRRPRKVRAPKGRALGNTQAGRPDGKWHRNIPPFVAKAMKGKGEMVR